MSKHKKNHDAPHAKQDDAAAAGPDLGKLDEQFRALTLLMYDTSVEIPVLEERVYPYLAPNIEFIDGILTATSAAKFRVGLRGFHCVFWFDFDIFQSSVKLNARGDGGRAMVDGIMNLRSVPHYTYPLRTILVYDFTLSADGQSFQITRLEEMWSYADLLENAPLIGRLFRASRVVAGYFFTGFFWLGSTLRNNRALSSRRKPGEDLKGPARYQSWLAESRDR